MGAYGVSSLKNDKMTISRVAPTTSTTFDSATFKTDHPTLYPKYLYMLYKAPPITVERKCPMWKGFAIFGDE